jgi:hypothetical protein
LAEVSRADLVTLGLAKHIGLIEHHKRINQFIAEFTDSFLAAGVERSIAAVPSLEETVDRRAGQLPQSKAVSAWPSPVLVGGLTYDRRRWLQEPGRNRDDEGDGCICDHQLP